MPTVETTSCNVLATKAPEDAKHTTAHKCNLVWRGRQSLLLLSCLVRFRGELPRAGGESGVKGGAPERGKERAWKDRHMVTTPPQHTMQHPASPITTTSPPPFRALALHHRYSKTSCVILFTHLVHSSASIGCTVWVVLGIRQVVLYTLVK